MYLASELIKIAEAEVGYLEKETNSQLDSFTANAGDGNWTKYARDLDAITGFYNGKKNGYAWCDMFVDWCFVKAFGLEGALFLTCQPMKSYGAGCTASSQYYKKKGQFFTTPKVGDQIFFGTASDVAHTGLVYKVDANKVYTIEGNTSSAAGVVANGGCVRKKSYSLSYSKIYGYGRPLYDAEVEKAEETKQEPQKETATETTSKGEKTVNIELTELENGAKGEQVKTLQRLLKALGYKMTSASGKTEYGVDGSFGGATERAVRAFQKAKGLFVDGVVGKNTWSKLLKG